MIGSWTTRDGAKFRVTVGGRWRTVQTINIILLYINFSILCIFKSLIYHLLATWNELIRLDPSGPSACRMMSVEDLKTPSWNKFIGLHGPPTNPHVHSMCYQSQHFGLRPPARSSTKKETNGVPKGSPIARKDVKSLAMTPKTCSCAQGTLFELQILDHPRMWSLHNELHSSALPQSALGKCAQRHQHISKSCVNN